MAQANHATPWLKLLAPLRQTLSESDRWGRVGSLRWLEAAIAKRGGRAGTVRNILYKDLGSLEEKQRLFELIGELYLRAGLRPPAPPAELSKGQAKRLLDRGKRRIFNRFLRELSAGACPRYVVVGGPASGKGVLLEQLRQALPEHLFINLAQELSPTLFAFFERCELLTPYQRLIAQLSSAQPYALQAALQRECRALLQQALEHLGQPLLLRAEAEATLGGLALRGDSGQAVSLPQWLEPLLAELELPYVAALSSPPARLSYQLLKPPSRSDARRYLRQSYPQLAPERLEELLNQAGRHYGELSRLALIELCRKGEGDDAALLHDSRLGPLLRALAVLSPPSDPALPLALLEAVLGSSVTTLSSAQRALLELLPDGMVRPALREVLAEVPHSAELHRTALAYYRHHPNPYRLLYHALGAGELEFVVAQLELEPSRLALVPELWRGSAAWPKALRERLAMVVVRYRAVLGDYSHPEAKAALALLADSNSAFESAWARVKMAEAHIDAGRYAEACALTRELPALSDEAEVERLLVQAAIARWRGAYREAQQAVAQARALPSSPLLQDRVRLWQGLVAKDAGRFAEALSALRQVRHNLLLAGRARYQEGDLLTRLGRPQAGAARIARALELLQHAPDEERARVAARYGTALRHLGRFEAAQQYFDTALKLAPDPFTRARIRSERAIFEAARSRPLEALELAAEAQAFFRATCERPQEAAYRYRRSRYRLAVAYRLLETGEPYCPPWRGGMASPHAAELALPLLDEVAPLAAQADRYAALYADLLALLALALPADAAQALLKRYPPPPHPYLQQLWAMARSELALRLGELAEAQRELAQLGRLPPDPGLRVWREALTAELLLRSGESEAACRLIDAARRAPLPFRRQLGRVWGRVLAELKCQRLAQRWLSEPLLPLPEALGLHFAADGN